jgi:hypothetical protein
MLARVRDMASLLRRRCPLPFWGLIICAAVWVSCTGVLWLMYLWHFYFKRELAS